VSQVAVIGSGISGLAAAYYLSRKHDVFLFEREDRLGGHTHTVTVDSSAGPLPVDTGFIVHNDLTYPNLIRLLAELGIPRRNSDMSFAVSCRKTGYEYSSRGVRGFFAQKRNLFSPRPWKLFAEIRRFNREAPRALENADLEHLKLGEFLDRGGYSSEFRELYLLPMASAVWSCAHHAATEFPAATLIRFFDNHRFLTITGQAQWKTIPGGCSRYIDPITRPLKDRIFTGVRLQSVSRDVAGVKLRFADGRPEMRFDQAVFATHGDQVLPLLGDASEHERQILGGFETSRNEVTLHTDETLLPQRPAARASWNYLLHLDGRNGDGPATMTYHMNRLQSLPVRENFCITLNARNRIRPEKILRNFIYNHPLYTRQAIVSQKRWAEISGQNRIHFCGAYWMYGFHEDGVNSALRVARALGVQV
jgi:predicted NAD/FAD-binding protein